MNWIASSAIVGTVIYLIVIPAFNIAREFWREHHDH